MSWVFLTSLKSVSLRSVLQRTLVFDLIFQQREKKKSKVRCVDPCCYLLSGAIIILLAVINMCILVTCGPGVQALLLTPPCPTFLCYMAASVSPWFSFAHFNALYNVHTHNSALPCTAHPVLTLPTFISYGVRSFVMLIFQSLLWNKLPDLIFEMVGLPLLYLIIRYLIMWLWYLTF